MLIWLSVVNPNMCSYPSSKETPQAGSCDPEEQDESRLVPEQILSLIQLPLDQPISDLSLPWAALVLLPHLRYALFSLFSLDRSYIEFHLLAVL